MYLLILKLAVLLSSFISVSAQIGTQQQNISSDSTAFTYFGTWRSSIIAGGIYEAYSNQSVANVTFSFIGVAATYIAIKKSDRGLCMLTIDGGDSYTVDLYDDSGYQQQEIAIWTSPVMPYGHHNVTISQIGPDARFGYFPYLFTETWIATTPINITAYTATQVNPSTPTSAPTPSSNSAPFTTNIAPIVGGVVGGVIALFLLIFLFILYRRDKQNRARGMVQKVKKSDGKMNIEDEVEVKRDVAFGNGNGYGGNQNVYLSGGHQGYNDFSSNGRSGTYDSYNGSSGTQSNPQYQQQQYQQQQQQQQQNLQYSQPQQLQQQNFNQYSSAPQSQPQSFHSQSSNQPLFQQQQQQPQQSQSYHAPYSLSPSPGAGTYQSQYSSYDSRPSQIHSANYDPIALSGNSNDSVTRTNNSGAYPYHVQGSGDDKRSYAIPEI